MLIELVVASVVIVVNVIVANVISAIIVVELGLDPLLLDLLTASLGSPAELCDYLNPMQWNCCTEVYNLL